MIDISHATIIHETPTHIRFDFSGKKIIIPKKYLKQVDGSYYVEEAWVDRMWLKLELATGDHRQ